MTGFKVLPRAKRRSNNRGRKNLQYEQSVPARVQYKNDERYLGGCAPYAIHVVTGIDLDAVFECAKLHGWRRGEGMAAIQTLLVLRDLWDFSAKLVFPDKPTTLAELLPKLRKDRNFIVHVPGHAIAVRQGINYDEARMPADTSVIWHIELPTSERDASELKYHIINSAGVCRPVELPGVVLPSGDVDGNMVLAKIAQAVERSLLVRKGLLKPVDRTGYQGNRPNPRANGNRDPKVDAMVSGEMFDILEDAMWNCGP